MDLYCSVWEREADSFPYRSDAKHQVSRYPTSAAWAAAKRAIGTRNGLQLT